MTLPLLVFVYYVSLFGLYMALPISYSSNAIILSFCFASGLLSVCLECLLSTDVLSSVSHYKNVLKGINCI